MKESAGVSMLILEIGTGEKSLCPFDVILDDACQFFLGINSFPLFPLTLS